MEESKDKAEEEKPDIKKSPEYRRFKKLLRRVVKAPPLKRIKQAHIKQHGGASQPNEAATGLHGISPVFTRKYVHNQEKRAD